MKTTLNFHSLLLLVFLFVLTACDKNDCMENSKSNCYCTMEYNPVCGCNDKTYGNACAAECSGIENYTPGECK